MGAKVLPLKIAPLRKLNKSMVQKGPFVHLLFGLPLTEPYFITIFLESICGKRA